MKTLSTMLIASMAFLVVSCCSCSKGSPKIGNLESARWELIEFDNQPVTDDRIILTFDGEKKMMFGEAPCNNFFGGYSLFEKTENNIKFSAIGMTRKFCPDAELEERFVGRLDAITRIKMEGDKMLMLDSQGTLVAVFRVYEK